MSGLGVWASETPAPPCWGVPPAGVKARWRCTSGFARRSRTDVKRSWDWESRGVGAEGRAARMSRARSRSPLVRGVSGGVRVLPDMVTSQGGVLAGW